MVVSKLIPGLGVYTEEGFFDGPTCKRLKAEVRAGMQTRARVYEMESVSLNHRGRKGIHEGHKGLAY